MGHAVMAVEPVEKFGMPVWQPIRCRRLIGLMTDFPTWSSETKRRRQFDLVVRCAVWQHLNDRQRLVAMRSIAEATTPGGLVIMSLRHGPGSPERTAHPVVAKETVDVASKEGFTLLRRAETQSVQLANRKNGIHWTWLAFARR
jgi:SAM-dependent methyltransferase